MSYQYNEQNESNGLGSGQLVAGLADSRSEDQITSDPEVQTHKAKILIVHIFNIPPGVKWRQIKNELLLPSGIAEETVLHIQVFHEAGSCIVSLSSEESADILTNELDGVNWNGFVLMVRTDDQVKESFNVSQPVLGGNAAGNSIPQPQLSPLFNNLQPNLYPISPIPYQNAAIYGRPPTGAPSIAPFAPQYQNSALQYSDPNQVRYSSGYNAPVYGFPGQIYPSYYQIPESIQPQISNQYNQSTPAYNRNLSHSSRSYSNATPSTSNTSTTSSSTTLSGYKSGFNQNRSYKTSSIPSSPISFRALQSLRQYPYQNITEIETIPDKTRLFIGNIPYSAEWTDLKDYLRSAGSIQRVEIPTELDGGSKGYAIANYENETDAKRAIDLFHGVNFQGRPLTVRYDRYPSRRGSALTSELTYDPNPPLISKANDIVHLTNPIEEKSQRDIKVYEQAIVTEDDKRYEDEARNLIESISALKFSS